MTCRFSRYLSRLLIAHPIAMCVASALATLAVAGSVLAEPVFIASAQAADLRFSAGRGWLAPLTAAQAERAAKAAADLAAYQYAMELLVQDEDIRILGKNTGSPDFVPLKVEGLARALYTTHAVTVSTEIQEGLPALSVTVEISPLQETFRSQLLMLVKQQEILERYMAVAVLQEKLLAEFDAAEELILSLTQKTKQLRGVGGEVSGHVATKQTTANLSAGEKSIEGTSSPVPTTIAVNATTGANVTAQTLPYNGTGGAGEAGGTETTWATEITGGTGATLQDEAPEETQLATQNSTASQLDTLGESVQDTRVQAISGASEESGQTTERLATIIYSDGRLRFTHGYSGKELANFLQKDLLRAVDLALAKVAARANAASSGLVALSIYHEALPSFSGVWAAPKKNTKIFEEALTISPESPLILGALAELQLQNDRPLEASQLIDKAISKAPEIAFLYDIRGVIYLRQQSPTLAASAFGDAIAREPRNTTYRMHRASAAFILGDMSGMCTDFHTACVMGDCSGYQWARQENNCLPETGGTVLAESSQKALDPSRSLPRSPRNILESFSGGNETGSSFAVRSKESAPIPVSGLTGNSSQRLFSQTSDRKTNGSQSTPSALLPENLPAEVPSPLLAMPSPDSAALSDAFSSGPTAMQASAKVPQTTRRADDQMSEQTPGQASGQTLGPSAAQISAQLSALAEAQMNNPMSADLDMFAGKTSLEQSPRRTEAPVGWVCSTEDDPFTSGIKKSPAVCRFASSAGGLLDEMFELSSGIITTTEVVTVDVKKIREKLKNLPAAPTAQVLDNPFIEIRGKVQENDPFIPSLR